MAKLLNEERVRRELVSPLSRMLKEVIEAAGAADATLRAAVLYGSAAGKNYVSGKSDVNVLLVFDSVELNLLRSLRTIFRKYSARFKGHPVVLDSEYIADSLDVFPMEFLEWKEHHITLYGEDFLSGLEVSGKNLRHEIEENLRGKKMRLIQSFFEIDERHGKLQPFLESTLPNFLVCFRNIMRLLNLPIAADIPSLLREVAEQTGASLSNISRLHQIKMDRLRLGRDEVEILFRGYVEDIAGVIRFIDKFDRG